MASSTDPSTAVDEEVRQLYERYLAVDTGDVLLGEASPVNPGD